MCHCRARASRDGHGVMIPPGCVIIHRAMTRYLVPVILKVCRECPGSHGSRKRRWKLPTYLVIPAMIPGCTVGRTASEQVPVIRRASSMRIWNHSKNNVSNNRTHWTWGPRAPLYWQPLGASAQAHKSPFPLSPPLTSRLRTEPSGAEPLQEGGK